MWRTTTTQQQSRWYTEHSSSSTHRTYCNIFMRVRWCRVSTPTVQQQYRHCLSPPVILRAVFAPRFSRVVSTGISWIGVWLLPSSPKTSGVTNLDDGTPWYYTYSIQAGSSISNGHYPSEQQYAIAARAECRPSRLHGRRGRGGAQPLLGGPDARAYCFLGGILMRHIYRFGMSVLLSCLFFSVRTYTQQKRGAIVNRDLRFHTLKIHVFPYF